VSRSFVLVSGLVLFAVVHSVLAADRVRRAGEGRLGARVYRIAYNVVAVLILAGTLWAARGAYPNVWRVTGIARGVLLAVQGIAVLGFIATVRSFELGEFLGTRAPRQPANGRFRADGMYARCRHPLYFFTALFFSAWPTMDLRALVLAVWLWAYGYFGSIIEERKLVAEFGQVYVEYRARTPRLLPLGQRR
jgi:methanethiol S-methyltransferase